MKNIIKYSFINKDNKYGITPFINIRWLNIFDGNYRHYPISEIIKHEIDAYKDIAEASCEGNINKKGFLLKENVVNSVDEPYIVGLVVNPKYITKKYRRDVFSSENVFKHLAGKKYVIDRCESKDEYKELFSKNLSKDINSYNSEEEYMEIYDVMYSAVMDTLYEMNPVTEAGKKLYNEFINIDNYIFEKYGVTLIDALKAEAVTFKEYHNVKGSTTFIIKEYISSAISIRYIGDKSYHKYDLKISKDKMKNEKNLYSLYEDIEYREYFVNRTNKDWVQGIVIAVYKSEFNSNIIENYDDIIEEAKKRNLPVFINTANSNRLIEIEI